MNDFSPNPHSTPIQTHNQTTLIIGPDGQATIYRAGQPRPPGRWEAANRDPYSWLRQGKIHDLAQLTPRARLSIACRLAEITNELNYDYKPPSQINTWIWQPRPPHALAVTLAETTAFIDDAVKAFGLREQRRERALLASLRARVDSVPAPSASTSQPHQQPVGPAVQEPPFEESGSRGGKFVNAEVVTGGQCMHNGWWHQVLPGGYCMNHGFLFTDVDFIYGCEICRITWCRYCCREHGKFWMIDYA